MPQNPLKTILFIAVATMIFIALVVYFTLPSVNIINRPIEFGQKRYELTQQYIKEHYGLDVKDIRIKPQIIVVHWTGFNDLNSSFERMNPEILMSDRVDISNAGALNVSAHFLVDRDGTIYRLLPENIMARHTIGLNYSSIGIENVGGANSIENLTTAQLKANVNLVSFLKDRYPDIDYLIGHHEYQNFEESKLWLERDESYRTVKHDPGDKFMGALRKKLKLSASPL